MSCTSKKVDWGDVLAIERMPDKIVWLEEGLDDAQALAKYGKGASGRGFRHILEEHASHFTKPTFYRPSLFQVHPHYPFLEFFFVTCHCFSLLYLLYHFWGTRYNFIIARQFCFLLPEYSLSFTFRYSFGDIPMYL